MRKFYVFLIFFTSIFVTTSCINEAKTNPNPTKGEPAFEKLIALKSLDENIELPSDEELSYILKNNSPGSEEILIGGGEKKDWNIYLFKDALFFYSRTSIDTYKAIDSKNFQIDKNKKNELYFTNEWGDIVELYIEPPGINGNGTNSYILTLKKDGKSLKGTVINSSKPKQINNLPDNFNETYTTKKILESCGAGNKALLTYFDETVVKFQKDRLILKGTVAGDIIGGYGSHVDKAELSLGTPDEVIALRDNITQLNYMGTFYYWDGPESYTSKNMRLNVYYNVSENKCIGISITKRGECPIEFYF